jgi:polyisoprenyl-phosphate glycosyltransferase
MKTAASPVGRPPVSDALVSVVVPVYNEAAVLEELCQRLRAALVSCRTTFEIIFINDGSSDDSGARLDRLARFCPEVRVVHLSRNFGHQAAIHAGLCHANGDAVVLMDSDLQDPPEAIGAMLEAWQAGNDVVYATRTARKEGLWKRVLFAGFHRFLSSIARTPIPVDAGNFGLMDARVVRMVAALGERDRYLPGLRSWVGFTQIGIPIERGQRYDRRPRVSLRGLVRLAKTAIFSFSALPLAIFAWLGIIAMTLFLGVSGYSVYCKLFTNAAIPGWTSQLVTMSFFAALNALGISMLGEYVVRIYDQVRARPLYLVERTTNLATDAEERNDAGRANAARDQEVDLRHLDPLEIDSNWDSAYRHLLNQAEDLIELGSLMRSEEADRAESASRESVTAEPVGAPAENEFESEEPRVLMFSKSR